MHNKMHNIALTTEASISLLLRTLSRAEALVLSEAEGLILSGAEGYL